MSIKANTEQEARDKFTAFARGDDDAEGFVMYAIAADGYELSDYWMSLDMLMQYTGIKDKMARRYTRATCFMAKASLMNGDKGWHTDQVKAIDFEDGAFRFDGEPLGDMFTSFLQFEIIGNIYEHPHLLTNEK